MNSSETNNQLLFPIIFKEAWGAYKQKWRGLYTLSLLPVLFVLLIYSIFISIIYIVIKLAGGDDLVLSATSILEFAPKHLAVFSILCLIITVLGVIYFVARSLIATIKILESETKMSVRHAWHGITLKSILSLLAVAILLSIILAGGYILFFVPFLFLITFYSNAVFANLVEGKKGIEALALSREYVKGYGTIVFVNLLVIFGVGMLFNFLFRIAMTGLGFLPIAAYYGEISISLAIVITIFVTIIVSLVLILWNSFSFVVLYSMFKKLQKIKANHSTSLVENKKTVKTWLIASIVIVSILVGVMSALEYDRKELQPQKNREMMRMQGGRY